MVVNKVQSEAEGGSQQEKQKMQVKHRSSCISSLLSNTPALIQCYIGLPPLLGPAGGQSNKHVLRSCTRAGKNSQGQDPFSVLQRGYNFHQHHPLKLQTSELYSKSAESELWWVEARDLLLKQTSLVDLHKV